MVLEDEKIIKLYWDRNQTAITTSEEKYGAYCHQVAWNILRQTEDADECVNDTWLKSWEAMPPERPKVLKYFFSAITRNLSLDYYKKSHRMKRGGGQGEVALEELSECISNGQTPEDEVMAEQLGVAINQFLKAQKERERNVFIRRYYFMETANEIGEKYGLSERNVLMILSRIRKSLKTYLVAEGFMN